MGLSEIEKIIFVGQLKYSLPIKNTHTNGRPNRDTHLKNFLRLRRALINTHLDPFTPVRDCDYAQKSLLDFIVILTMFRLKTPIFRWGLRPQIPVDIFGWYYLQYTGQKRIFNI